MVLKFVVVIAIFSLVLSALAPLFYAFAPQYVPISPAASDIMSQTEVVESIVTE